jgi:hypothetical protein
MKSIIALVVIVVIVGLVVSTTGCDIRLQSPVTSVPVAEMPNPAATAAAKASDFKAGLTPTIAELQRQGNQFQQLVDRASDVYQRDSFTEHLRDINGLGSSLQLVVKYYPQQQALEHLESAHTVASRMANMAPLTSRLEQEIRFMMIRGKVFKTTIEALSGVTDVSVAKTKVGAVLAEYTNLAQKNSELLGGTCTDAVATAIHQLVRQIRLEMLDAADATGADVPKILTRLETMRDTITN